jgi:hypothetical protein
MLRIKHRLIRQIGFKDANLKRILDTVAIKDVVICAMSHMCVESAIRSTNDFGEKCCFITDKRVSKDVIFDGVQIPEKL